MYGQIIVSEMWKLFRCIAFYKEFSASKSVYLIWWLFLKEILTFLIYFFVQWWSSTTEVCVTNKYYFETAGINMPRYSKQMRNITMNMESIIYMSRFFLKIKGMISKHSLCFAIYPMLLKHEGIQKLPATAQDWVMLSSVNKITTSQVWRLLILQE